MRAGLFIRFCEEKLGVPALPRTNADKKNHRALSKLFVFRLFCLYAEKLSLGTTMLTDSFWVCGYDFKRTLHTFRALLDEKELGLS